MPDPTVPPRAVWRQFQTGSWEATWLHAWERRPDGWWGLVVVDADGHRPQLVMVPEGDLRPRDPLCRERVLSRISGEPPGP